MLVREPVSDEQHRIGAEQCCNLVKEIGVCIWKILVIVGGTDDCQWTVNRTVQLDQVVIVEIEIRGISILHQNLVMNFLSLVGTLEQEIPICGDDKAKTLHRSQMARRWRCILSDSHRKSIHQSALIIQSGVVICDLLKGPTSRVIILKVLLDAFGDLVLQGAAIQSKD